MRLLLALALAIHLSGIPAAVASPCAVPAKAESDCCMRHHTATGGDVIGYCACPVPDSQADTQTAVSVAPSSSDRSELPALVALPAVPVPPSQIAFTALQFTLAHADFGPPPLDTGTSLRC